ncbi:hypothetical protein H0H92_013038 [Tricholoma furcatifolium]|nr:hypothetical protein H0H92_013037 [Tricholoma furcatifolium]KAG6827145.1 hypothetical protein H0H92_013038 [Tricholoma furcatifolium]
MLFHNLGRFAEDPILKARVQGLFQTNVDTFFMNASGTGKTRLLYEGLCQNWGFYFTSGINLGEAKTLCRTLETGILEEDAIMKELPEKSALSFDLTLARNREILYRRFLLAHLLVFRDFIKTASTLCGGIDDNHRKRWLVAQLSPFCLDHSCDSFLAILQAFKWETLAVIKARLTQTLGEIRPLLPECIKTNGLFIVIDEANAAHTEFWHAHTDDGGEYPALRELIIAWREQMSSLDVPLTFIVAGTDIPTRYFPSSDMKWSSWRWTSNTGLFDLPEKQKEYVHSFLPSSLLDTPSGDALLKRVLNWCGTRHRFTATTVEILLEEKLVRHPHGALNRCIKYFTEYQPHDADEYTGITLEGTCTCMLEPSFQSIGASSEKTPRVQFTVHQVIFRYILTGKGPSHFGNSRIELVTSGVGRFIDKDMSMIAVDEPFVLVGAALYLSRYNRKKRKKHSLTSFDDFCSYFQDHWPSGDTYEVRNYLAFALAHTFAEGRALNEVFTVPAPPVWMGESSEPASLVVLRKVASGFTRELVLDSSALLPSAPPLGFVACTADDVISWLNHERSAAFCFCPPECGAELIFVLKIKEKNFWVVLRTAGRGTRSPDIDHYEECERLELENLFPDPTISKRLSDAFDSLPSSAGSTSVLRVLASFPIEPEFPRNVAQRLKKPPAASLNNATFKAVTESIDGSSVIEALVSSMQGKRSEYRDSIFNTITTDKSRKPPSKDVSMPSLREDVLEDEKSNIPLNSKNKVNRRNRRTKAASPTTSSNPLSIIFDSAVARTKTPSPKTPPSPGRTSLPVPSKPYSRSRKSSGDGESTSLSEPPLILRRSPREHRVSGPSSKG